MRGEVLHSGWVVEPFEQATNCPSLQDEEEEEIHDGLGVGRARDSVYCTYVVCLDPRGMVPNWMANMFRVRDVEASFLRLKTLAEEAEGAPAPQHLVKVPTRNQTNKRFA